MCNSDEKLIHNVQQKKNQNEINVAYVNDDILKI